MYLINSVDSSMPLLVNLPQSPWCKLMGILLCGQCPANVASFPSLLLFLLESFVDWRVEFMRMESFGVQGRILLVRRI
jgi:hypothetical protein